MTTDTTTFEPVENARWVEVRSYRPGEEPAPWIRSNLDKPEELVRGLSTVAMIEHPDDMHGPISERVRRVGFLRATFENGVILEVQTLSRYGGIYEQVEALRRFVRELDAETSNSDGDVGSEMIDRELVTRALDDILAHDRFERDALAREGHCRHGVYVGGCGVDWMCGACEDGQE